MFVSERRPLAVFFDKRAARKSGRAARAVANLITHQFRAVRKLDAEPIPAFLVIGRRPSSEFSIHPRQTVKMFRRTAVKNDVF